VNAFNNTVLAKDVEISVRGDAVSTLTRAVDLGQGSALDVKKTGRYRRVRTTVPALQNTVIEFGPNRK